MSERLLLQKVASDDMPSAATWEALTKKIPYGKRKFQVQNRIVFFMHSSTEIYNMKKEARVSTPCLIRSRPIRN